MKFAIYGDSFAESSFHFDPKPELDRLAWTTLLAQRLGATSIDYYALGGSSFFYSYQRMLATADQYDQAIIAVSEPNRYTKTIAGHKFTGPPLLNERYKGVSIADMKHLIGWFASLDEDFMEIAQELLIRDIEARWPATVIVPSFPRSFTAARAARWHNFGLWDINLMGLKQLGLDEGTNTLHERHTVNGILCHIPVEWHSAVADLIYNFLQTGSIAVPPLVLKHGLDNYYTSS
jgi:hypothetical protein